MAPTRPTRAAGPGPDRRMLAVVLLVATALPWTIGATAGPPDLFGPGAERRAEAGLRRSRTAVLQLDLDGISGPITVNLNLFADRNVPTTLHRSARTDGVAEWTGRVPGHPGTAVVILVDGATVFGNVHLGTDGEYTIRSSVDGVVVAEVDPAIPGSDVVMHPSIAGDATAVGADIGDPILDVMIVWTPEVLSDRFGGDPALGRIWAEARATELSTVFADSQVAGSARVAYAGTAGYDESPHTIFDNLYHFTFAGGVDCFSQIGFQDCDPDGELDKERAQRDLIGADVAVLVVDDPYGSVSGVAWSICRAGDPPHPSVETFCSATYGFAVVSFDSADGNWTMSHEIGHILGGFHDAATNTASCSSEPECAELDEYNRGYRIVDTEGSNGFSTVMAYAVNGAPRVGFFSNPDLTWAGEPMGIPIGQAGEADNASHFAASLPTAAGFRDRLDCRGRTPTLIGTAGADVIVGTEGADVILSFGGDDTIDGNGGDDLICAGDGEDDITGGEGKDKIYGQNGADTIYGNAKSDRLYGGGGLDVIRGGTGTRDRLYGGDGVDDLDGGPGDDDRCTLGEAYAACETIF